jgi:AraC family ethanolamine operon transcriptional activator
MSAFRKEILMMLTRCDYQSLEFDSFDAVSQLRLGDDPFEQRLLKGGQFRATLERLSLPSSRIDRGVYSLPCLGRGAIDRGWINIGITDWTGDPAWVNGVQLHAADIQLFSEGAAVDYRCVPSGAWYAFQVRRDYIQKLAIELNGVELPIPDRGFRNFHLTRTAAAKFKSALQTSLWVGRHLSETPSGVSPEWMENQLASSVLQAINVSPLREDGRTERASDRNWKIVRMLEEFIREFLQTGFAMRDLVAATATSERSLQYLVKNAYGVSPSELLLITRLHRIREKLLTCDRESVTVRAIARNFGMFHGGRLASHYKRLFGESPHETIANRREGMPPVVDFRLRNPPAQICRAESR